MKKHWAAVAAVVGFVGLSFSQTGRQLVLPGSPLPGITPSEHEMFRLGLEDFTEVETAEDGLGPAFNGNSCAVCHSVPGDRRHQHDDRGPRWVPRREREVHSIAWRHAVPPLLDAASSLPGADPSRSERDRAARSDTALRRRTRRGDQRRDDHCPRRPGRPRRRWHPRARRSNQRYGDES